MPQAICNHCQSTFSWHWEEAFAKWGFLAGQGQLKTETVQEALTDAGYEVEVRALGACNTVIYSIQKAGKELIPEGIKIGYVHRDCFCHAALLSCWTESFPQKSPMTAYKPKRDAFRGIPLFLQIICGNRNTAGFLQLLLRWTEVE